MQKPDCKNISENLRNQCHEDDSVENSKSDLRNSGSLVVHNKRDNNARIVIDKVASYREMLEENFGVDRFLREEDREIVNELIACALDVICTEGKTVRINREDKSRDLVKSVYLKLNSEDIDHVLDRYKQQRHQIKRVHSYFKTMLYNVKQERMSWNANAMRVDGLVS